MERRGRRYVALSATGAGVGVVGFWAGFWAALIVAGAAALPPAFAFLIARKALDLGRGVHAACWALDIEVSPKDEARDQ